MLWRRRSSEEIRVFVFSNDLMTSDAWGRQGLDYIALRVQREPLDQTDLSNDLDAILKAVENRHSKVADRWGPLGLGGTTYRPADPTWQWVEPRFGDSPSGPF